MGLAPTALKRGPPPRPTHWTGGPFPQALQRRHRESAKVLAGLAFFEMLSQYPRGSPKGSAAVADPNPPRPFTRYRWAS